MAVPDAPKQFVPLESNPQVFNSMLHDLGGSPNLAFHDVYSISDPDLLAIVPRPVYALVLILPFALSTYKADKEKEEAVQKDYVGDESDDDVCFIRQTIHNACSLWSIFHAVCNEPAKHHISMSSPFSHPLPHLILTHYKAPNSLFARLLALPPLERPAFAARSEEVDAAYATASKLCDSADWPDPSLHPDYGYVCFVKSKSGWLWEMDGERKGPARREKLAPGEDDLLGETVFGRIRKYMDDDKDVRFSLMALVDEGDGA
jgi:ubiquitin carboxyl-terminal hydrolase L3